MSNLVRGLVATSTMKDPTEVAVLECLADHANDYGESCFAGIPRIAKLVRRSERMVIRVIQQLEEDGWLSRVVGNGAGNLTQYTLNVDKLKGCQDVTLLPRSKKSKRVTPAQQRVTPETQKGDTGDTAYKEGTLFNSKSNSIPPNPPQAGGGGSIDSAVAQVSSALGITNRRTKRLLRDGIALAAEKGELPPTIALEMIAAWNRQAANGPLLHRKFGIKNFFSDGIWRDEDRWLWNEELLRLRAGASAGSR